MTAPDNPSLEQVLLGLGANLGDRRANLRKGIDRLAAAGGIRVLAESPIYESEPVGYRNQPPFLNLALGIETTLPPESLLDVLLEIERSAGRVRTFLNAPRTLDIDILFYGRHTVRTPRLIIPHPRCRERAFVVVPLENLLTHPAFRHDPWTSLREELKTNPARTGIKQFET